MKKILSLFLAALATASPAAATPILRITEVMSSSGSGGTADWFEVTNYGDTDADITGYRMDDNSFDFARSVPLNDVTSIAPGESVIFLESSGGAAIPDFRTFWGRGETPQIGYYSGSGVGFSSGGDGAVVYDAVGGEAAPRVNFGAATAGQTFYWAYTPSGEAVATESGKVSADGLLDGQSTFTTTGAVTNTGSPGTAAIVVPAGIATLYWTASGSALGGNGTWSAAGATWSTNPSTVSGTAWIAGKEAAFGGTAGTVQVDAAQSARALSFAVDGYTLSGSGGITLSDGIVAVSSNATAVIAAALAGTNGLTGFGYGTIVLSGANTYSGATSVALGSIALGAGQGLPSGSPVTTARFTTFDFGGHGASVGGLGGVGTLTNFGGTLTINIPGSANVRLDGRLSGTGDVVIDSDGTGAQRFDSSAQSRTDGALKDYTGRTIVRRGVLEVDAAGDPVFNGVPVATSEVMVEGDALTRGELVLAGDGGVYAFGLDLPELPVITLAGGTIGNDRGETVDLYNNIAVTGTGSVITSRGAGDGVATFDGEFHFWGDLSGDGALGKSGQGILFLHEPLSFTGAWDIANGVVDVQTGATTGSGPVAVTRTPTLAGEDIGVLRGRGTVGGDAVVGGEIDLLAESGQLTIAGDLDLLPGGVLRFHFSGQAVVTGAFRAQPGAVLHVEGTPVAGLYSVLLASGGLSGASSVVVTGLAGTGLAGTVAAEGNTLVLTIAADTGETYAAWSGGVAPGTDVNGNGYTALAEFALGAAAPGAPFTVPVQGATSAGGTNFLTLTAIVRTNGTGLIVVGQSAASLSTSDAWTAVDVDFVPTGATDVPDGCEERTYRTPAEGARKFLRLLMELAP
ncbi:MAG: lamin tail domain-containing protein [Chthoniobacterales bacterium]